MTEDSHALVESGSDLECLDLLSEHLGKLVVDVVANAQPWSWMIHDWHSLDIDSVCCLVSSARASSVLQETYHTRKSALIL